MNTFRSFYAYLKSVNYCYLLVLGLVVKAIVYDVSYASFLLTIPILTFEAYKMWLLYKIPDPVKIPEEMQVQLDSIKSKLNAQTFDRNIMPQPKKFF